MTTIDVFREHRDEYAMPREPALVKVGAGSYLTVQGRGGPATADFARAVGALYGTAYTLKFARKRSGHDFKVGALEGLWTATAGGKTALAAPKSTWRWKLLMRVPEAVTPAAVRDALAELREKKGDLPRVALERIREGTVVQVLHVGSYAEEPRSLAKMDAFVRSRRLRYRGAHHEIYLSDPRRVPANRLRTILRHPVVAARAPRASTRRASRTGARRAGPKVPPHGDGGPSSLRRTARTVVS